jgi:uncharacterized protein (TIGR02646 family)
MIRVKRPATVPDVLMTDGRTLRAKAIECARNGDALSFDRDVYAHADVKASLRAAQHDKCCFCESKVSHVAFGDVEHFRPKAGFRGGPGEALTAPGYYWLAYEWTNLLYACEVCNRRHKGNLFPLAPNGVRARTPSDNLASEVPLFVDPTAQDPSLHIGFRQEYAYAIKGSASGEATIAALELNRPELAERRWDLLRVLGRLRDLTRVCKDADLVREARALLKDRVDDCAEYSAAARAAVRAAKAQPRRTRPRRAMEKPTATKASRPARPRVGR